MANDVLTYFREKDPRFRDVPDSELSDFIREKYPDFARELAPAKVNIRNIAPTIPTFKVPQPNYLGQAQQIFNQPVETARGAIGELGQGKIGEGTIDFARAAAQFVPAIYGGAVEATRAIPGIGNPLANALNIPGQVIGGLADVTRQGINTVGSFFPTSADESPVVQKANVLATELLPFAVGAGLPPMLRSAGRGLENTATSLATSAFRAGENLQQARGLGKFAQERGITLKENRGRLLTFKGRADAQTNIERINAQINNDVINPATQAGTTISGDRVRAGLQRLKSEFESELIPDNAAINAIDRQIASLDERLGANGALTPRQAQDLKVNNDRILARYYENRNKLGTLKRWEATKQEGIAAANSELRQQLEELHPQLKGANWEEGNYIQLRNAIDQFLFEKATGRGGPSLVVRARPGMGAGISLYDLMGFRPFRSKLAVVLGKAGRTLSGNKPTTPFTGFNSPYQAPPGPPPPIPPTSLMPRGGGGPPVPRPPFVGGSPNRRTPFTQQPGEANFTDVTPPNGGLPRGRILFLPEHKALVEGNGGKYRGTNAQGSIFFDEPNGSTGLIPKGAENQAGSIIQTATRKNAGGAPRKYSDADPYMYPTLGQMGKGSISPDWVLDSKTGKVKLAGEFADIDPYFLDLSNKPKSIAFGGIKYGNADSHAANLGFESRGALLEALDTDLRSYHRMQDLERVRNIPEITNERTIADAESRATALEAQAGNAAEAGDVAALDKALTEIESFLNEVSGEPAKFDKTKAGMQGNMFNTQAQFPKRPISSNIPQSKQIEGTMFEPQKPKYPGLFER